MSAFYDDVLDDEQLSRHFIGIDMRRMIDHQAKMISSILGGPAHVSDEQLARAHRRLDITVSDFNILRQILSDTLDDAGFEPSDRDVVLRTVDATKSFIVGG